VRARRLVAVVNKIKVGDPLSAELRSRTGILGPVVNARQHEFVLGHIKSALQAGAELLAGGGRPEKPAKGYFIEPTVLRVRRDMKIWHQEVFGPVLSVMTFSTEAEALELANDTEVCLPSVCSTCVIWLSRACFSTCMNAVRSGRRGVLQRHEAMPARGQGYALSTAAEVTPLMFILSVSLRAASGRDVDQLQPAVLLAAAMG
jgi:acyl-CoA reductase-like NAD-dependent aldehyde dehydrogenase